MFEIKEKGRTSMSKRREAPLYGLIFFNIVLWGSKLFTALSPGTSVIFPLLGYDIHFHHFHYGIIALVIGIIVTFFEGVYWNRFGHILFGAGLGFIVDEYWLLLVFDEGLYFTYNSFLISAVIGVIVSVIYASFVIALLIHTRNEKKMWDEIYEALRTGKLKIDF